MRYSRVLGPTAKTSELDRVLKPSQILLIGFGTIIGAGWLIVLAEWIGIAGSYGSIIAMSIGCVLMLTVGWCFAEIGSIYPESGGAFIYAHKSFGRPVGFLTGWSLVLVYTAVTAFEAISLSWILSTLIPGVRGVPAYQLFGHDVMSGDLLFAALGMAVIAILNFMSVEVFAKTQQLLTVLLIVVGIGLIIGGLTEGHTANLSPTFVVDRGPVMGILAVFVTVPFMFAGFDSIPQTLGERHPSMKASAVGWIITASILGAAVFYIAAILASSSLAPREELLAAELPIAAAFQAAFKVELVRNAALIAGAIGLLTTWNAVFYSGCRVLYAMSRAEMLPRCLSFVHPKRHVPVFGVAIMVLTSSGLVLIGRESVIVLAQVASLALAIIYLVVCAGVLKLRKKQMKRPFSVPGGRPVIVIAIVFCCFFLLVLANGAVQQLLANKLPVDWIIFCAWLVLGYFAWLISNIDKNPTDISHS